MTWLRPGDRRIRAVVRPEYFGEAARGPTWPCAACGVEFQKRDSRAVIHAPPDVEVPYAFMVCPDCALELTPVRLDLDRRRLDEFAQDGRRHDEPGAAGPLVAEYAAEILRMRGGQQPEVVRLRALDAHVLADLLETSRTGLVSQLHAMKVLSALDVRGSAVPLAPRPR